MNTSNEIERSLTDPGDPIYKVISELLRLLPVLITQPNEKGLTATDLQRYIQRMITAADKLLRAFIILASKKDGYPVKQEKPVCPACKLGIDLTDETIRVDYAEVEAGGRKFVVAEPTCPNCFIRVKPLPFISH